MRAFTKEKLNPLIEKHHRTLTLDDVDAIIELDGIAGRIEKSVKALSERDWFEIDGHFFLRPTFAREDLIRRISDKHGNGIFSAIGALYALDTNLPSSELVKTPGKLTLSKYAVTMDISIAKAMSKIEEIFGFTEDEGDGKEGEFDSWSLCCVIAREIGGSPDEWMDASPQKLRSAIKTIEDKADAEAKAMGGSGGPPKETPRMLALAEFSRKLNALEASWLA